MRNSLLILVDGRRVQTVDGYYAVKVWGRGHAVEHNFVTYFFDGIDVSAGCATDVAFYWHAPAPGRMRDYELAHDPMEFPSLEAFQEATGQERHGMLVDYDIFGDLEPAAARRFGGPDVVAFETYDSDALDFRLREDG